ncbi:hypothetical protein EX30DRAFT_329539 [Ascodesmis nigricans]|uniref:Uncharacterized protein n=1 Tax=Ascodesmis nigricans TaxID=341454 RepID=A0A4S2N2I1_9PEZI|nr:hypothetical protein EX30DRAFT_329539 [Ascodesmis nigricans]
MSAVPEGDSQTLVSAPPTELEDDPQELDDLVNRYGFSLQEALLFLRIRNRGHEPLMPAHWQVDFGTMPDSLFFDAEVANEVGHIDSITLDGTFSATNAFRGLVGLGCIVRGKMEAKKDPEDRILAEIRKYVRWSVEDVKKHLPGNNDIYPRVVLVGSYGKGSVHCENKMHRKLSDLRRIVLRESAHLRDAPLSPNAPASTPLTTSSTIYGIAVAGPVVALVTMHCTPEADPQGTKIKTMVTLDFSDTMMDFWNAVAVALLVIAAREDELERTEFYKGHDIKPFDIHNIEDGDWDEVRRGWEKTPLKSGRRESVGPLGWSPLRAVDDDEDDPDA